MDKTIRLVYLVYTYWFINFDFLYRFFHLCEPNANGKTAKIYKRELGVQHNEQVFYFVIPTGS